MNSSQTPVISGLHEIISIRFLTGYTFIIRFKRGDFQFRAGQRVIVGVQGDIDQREYSIYSGENDDYLEILVREVKDGNVSVRLKNCHAGQFLQINGPFGAFGIEQYDRYSKELVFVATGTGISPFHSIVRSYPGIKFTLYHGVCFAAEAYERDEYDASRYFLCTSKEKSENGIGRVTKYLGKAQIRTDALYLLCGNSNMIYDVFHILKDKGVPAENIFSEIYF